PAPAPAAAAAAGRRGIQQIVLRGPGLKTAWMRIPLATAWQPPVRDFTPQQHGAPMVFHGTNVSDLRSDWLVKLCEGNIRLHGNANQMAPWGVFHPSFYGLRSFLSAVFADEVGTLMLEGSALVNVGRCIQFGEP